MRTTGEQLLELICGELRSLHVQSRLFENEQRELGLLAAFVDSMAHGARDPSPVSEKLRKLADAIGNAALLATDGSYADLLVSQKQRIQQFLTHTAPERELRNVMIIADAAPLRGLLRSREEPSRVR